jgi:hypothetical protein
MFSLVISKATNKIVLAHKDGSFNMPIQTPQEQLEIFCDANNLNPSEFIALEYDWNLKTPISLSKHIYNPANGQIEVDPNWVQPTPPAQTTEPTA